MQVCFLHIISYTFFLCLFFLNLGLFYVIDGLLDVSMPSEDLKDSQKGKEVDRKRDKNRRRGSTEGGRQASLQSRYSGYFDSTSFIQSLRGSTKNQKHLFTVRPGGIAGYLGIQLAFFSSEGTRRGAEVRLKLF